MPPPTEVWTVPCGDPSRLELNGLKLVFDSTPAVATADADSSEPPLTAPLRLLSNNGLPAVLSRNGAGSARFAVQSQYGSIKSLDPLAARRMRSK